MNKDIIISSALRTIGLQSQSIQGLGAFIDENFEKAVLQLARCKGRLVVSGIGKSAIIAQKIVSTFNSTGTPSIFMHAADAIHGDLGMIQQDDMVMVISKSGNSPEIKVLAPLIKNFGNVLIGMVGNIQSFLANHCDIMLNTTVLQEACPHNLAPTTSTTAQMVMGDALAICLMELKSFNSQDFAKYHPGGALGKKLYLRVNTLAAQNSKPKVLPDAHIKTVIVEITRQRLGATAVVNENNELLGIITDGDLRRMIEKEQAFDKLLAKEIMSPAPKTIDAEALAVNALEIMKQNNINQLLVTENNKYAGLIHLHDLIREGII
ncbi:MAG: KpsF/GutQ family sugar-phosphate isomerase [Chitinophagaceae bacterium]|jgi:arabinose-5-phosphate isomerase|nr:KpsF/GutQ family sugar-phosphate isomerase [Chitinophagaceae bacterium]